MTPAYETAILGLAAASVPVNRALSETLPGFRYGNIGRRITIFFCATAGTILCFCILCHKGGIYQASDMDIELYYPLYHKILKMLEDLIKNNPNFLHRLGVLFMASRAGAELLPMKDVYVFSLLPCFLFFDIPAGLIPCKFNSMILHTRLSRICSFLPVK
jgi:hypothetical protein